MRLYLFPITRNRTLVYCKRSNIAASRATSSIDKTASHDHSSKSTDTSSSSNAPTTPPPPRPVAKPSIVERVQARANATWVQWEAAPSGWKKKVTGWGNQAFARIPYDEWGLKSIPPASRARLAEESQISKLAKDDSTRLSASVDVVFPSRLLDASGALSVLRRLSGPDRRREYRRRLWWSVAVMPLTIPFILVPVVPNLPFFYLVFRAWSYWRAGAGAARIDHLLTSELLSPKPSDLLQRVYDTAPLPEGKVVELRSAVERLRKEQDKGGSEQPDREIEAVAMGILGESRAEVKGLAEESRQGEREALLFPKGHGKAVALAINMPEVEAELERAHAQVEKALAKEEEKRQST